MIIIAFAPRTSKLLPRILCRRFKHTAPIIVQKNKLVMYQFVSRTQIAKIPLQMRDIKILGMYGWDFITLHIRPQNAPKNTHARTCVQMTKHIIGLRAPFIQTPYALYKKIRRLSTDF